MLGPIGASLMSIMRVLTPAEIDFYIEKAHESRVSAIAVGAEDQTDDYLHKNKPEYNISKVKDPKSDEQTQADVLELFPNKNELKEFLPHEDQPHEDQPHEDQPHEYQPHEETINLQDNHETNELESIGIFSANTIREQNRKINEEKRKATPSASVFLINERLKLKNSQQKLKGQVAIESYNKSLAKEKINREVSLDQEDDDKSSSIGISGILINKKQA